MAGAELVGRIVDLTAEVERLEDPSARRLAEQLSAAVLELHGEGLGWMLEALDDDRRRQLAADELIGGLLLLHGLHPVPLAERVGAGLDQVRPFMAAHGGDVELLGLEEGIARLRLTGNCDSCAASRSTLELAVEEALERTAPDLLGLDVEGAVEPEEATQVMGVPLPMAQEANAAGACPSALKPVADPVAEGL